MCGAEWKAARRAAAGGYTLVASDKSSRKPSRGVIRQYSQMDAGYGKAKKLLSNRKIDEFTTVTRGVGLPPAETRVSCRSKATTGSS